MTIMAFPLKLPAALKCDGSENEDYGGGGKHSGEGTVRTFLQWNKGAGRVKSLCSLEISRKMKVVRWGGVGRGSKGAYGKFGLGPVDYTLDNM